jgi:hypothetical protein
MPITQPGRYDTFTSRKPLSTNKFVPIQLVRELDLGDSAGLSERGASAAEESPRRVATRPRRGKQRVVLDPEVPPPRAGELRVGLLVSQARQMAFERHG